MQTSPLDDRHRALDAKMVPFGGWDMPLHYGSTTTEHLACRQDAVVFDVSHLGTVRLSGADAFALIQTAFTNDLNKIGPGRAQYTHLLDDVDGSVLDDIIVWWHPDGETFDVMPNASNTDAVVGAIGGDDVTTTRAVLAVQGPNARDRLSTFFADAGETGRFRVTNTTWEGQPVTIAGTGYTGEPGVEISVPADVAGSLWDAIIAAGVVPAGLGARDTLRLEAGLPLHGNELGPGITPLQAGLAWVVAFDKPDFRGKAALEAERERGVHRLLTGVITDNRRPLRAGAEIIIDGTTAGTLTSGNTSPSLGVGIGLGFVPPNTEVGTEVEVVMRGNSMPAAITKPPFVTS